MEGMDDINSGDAGASTTHPETANSMRKGDVVMLKGHPCKIVDYSSSKPGKHGAAKIKFCGLDVFTGSKYEEICSSTHNIDVPYVTRSEYTLMDVTEEDYLNLMDADGNCREDIKLPKDDEATVKTIRDGFDNGDNVVVCILKCMNQEKVASAKICN